MVKVGVIGCGYWGIRHVRNFHEIGGVQLSCVVDLNPERLREVQSRYPGVVTTQDYQNLLESDVEGVVVATPVSTHYQLAREALLHGKHVLVEKPMTASLAEAKDLATLAANQGKILMVGHTYEYNPAVKFMKEVLRSGEIGEVYCIDTARLNLGLFQPDVNVLWDLAPHDLSVILFLLEEEPTAVSARGAAHIHPSFQDVVYLELRFNHDILAHVLVSWLDPCKVRRFTVIGSKKMMVFDDLSENEKIRIYDRRVAPTRPNGDWGAWPVNYHYGNVTIPFIPNAEPLKQECSHFVDCIAQGKQARSDGWSGVRVVRILEEAGRSLLNGGARQELRGVGVRL